MTTELTQTQKDIIEKKCQGARDRLHDIMMMVSNPPNALQEAIDKIVSVEFNIDNLKRA